MSERDEQISGAVKRAVAAPLPKRFYKSVELREAPNGYAVTLDGKPVRTPGKVPLVAPSRGIADAIAAEWEAQETVINPATMPMTRLINSAIDGVAGREAEVAADVAKYAGSDLVCYRADFPEGLVALQTQHWDPVLAWARNERGWPLRTAVGVVHVPQEPATLAAIAEAVQPRNVFALAGLHSMTTLMGSALLALTVAERRLTPAEAWAAAHVDEDWQISQWGEDAEARARREHRWRDMQAAADLAR